MREPSSMPVVQLLSAVLWPSFLLAGVADGVFFTVFDPVALLECEGEPPMGRMAAYSVGFFLFWLLGAGASAACAYFLGAVQHRPAPGPA